MSVFLAFFAGICIFGDVVWVAQSQNITQSTTDPSEVSALKSIFQKWKILESFQGNINEPCLDFPSNSSVSIPFVICNCSYDNGYTCHITDLNVGEMDIVGEIPEELWGLTYLNSLNLEANYLTGIVSPSIGNLTRIKYINLGTNPLSGEIPKELGKLTELIQLDLRFSNYSGVLPSELGNLTNLERLYFDSSGVGGEIPSSFANLQNLIDVWASNNELIGRIPNFIGNWSRLSTLWLQGNSFEGPIPSSLNKLTSLRRLILTDVSNGSSSLEFIKDIKSLSVLILRNNNISGSIPSNIGEYASLTRLDLSFNNLCGTIPPSLFTISDLSDLYLGNNMLSGVLPEQKIEILKNIDLSYNRLSGSIPSWVLESNLQLNLVANNFTISNNSNLPWQLNCLQQNFPCNRGSGLYQGFAINCGGPQITSSNNIVYERDTNAIGPASYFVSEGNMWAVSNVGIVINKDNLAYTSSLSSQFNNTSDSKLFETARLSFSSLRYYGLGLQNGNYTVNLKFAETAFEDSTTWRSLGKRVFDIYIQGNRVLKDFDIRREAGGVSFPAVEKEFKACRVSENYLEIHLFWAGKGTCCIPVQGTYGASISAISVTPDFTRPVVGDPVTSKKINTMIIIWIVLGLGVAVILFLVVIVRRKIWRHNNDNEEVLGLHDQTYIFSYKELKTATEDFAPDNKLGEGGFGPVYKGTLDDGRKIAVKELSVTSHQGKNQFLTEIDTISIIQHRNLVQLYGCCTERDKCLLVYEYLENNSLDQALLGTRSMNLIWSIRYDICVGVARGLAYLHEESRLRIIHRDVKASNVLLDTDFTPKISDFGLARLYDNKKTHISTRVAGTIGYLAPEYAMRGHLTEKVDMFAFGILSLEILSGRPNSRLNEEGVYLLEEAWNLYENQREVELVDSKLSDFNEEEAKCLLRLAILCTQTSPAQRPPMSRVVAMLLGDIEVGNVISRPGYLFDSRFDDNICTNIAYSGSMADDVEQLTILR